MTSGSIIFTSQDSHDHELKDYYIELIRHKCASFNLLNEFRTMQIAFSIRYK